MSMLRQIEVAVALGLVAWFYDKFADWTAASLSGNVRICWAMDWHDADIADEEIRDVVGAARICKYFLVGLKISDDPHCPSKGSNSFARCYA